MSYEAGNAGQQQTQAADAGRPHLAAAMAVVSQIMGRIAKVDSSNPQWFAQFEDLDPDICSYDELMWLIATAPTPEAQAFLVGKHSLRQSIAQITGRPFL